MSSGDESVANSGLTGHSSGKGASNLTYTTANSSGNKPKHETDSDGAEGLAAASDLAITSGAAGEEDDSVVGAAAEQSASTAGGKHSGERAFLGRAAKGIQKSCEDLSSAVSAERTARSTVDKLRSTLAPIRKERKEKRKETWIMLGSLLGHLDLVWDITTCSWNTDFLATASADRTVRIFNTTQTKSTWCYVNHRGSVNSVQFHPSKRLVLTASGDQSCHVFKLPRSRSDSSTLSALGNVSPNPSRHRQSNRIDTATVNTLSSSLATKPTNTQTATKGIDSTTSPGGGLWSPLLQNGGVVNNSLADPVTEQQQPIISRAHDFSQTKSNVTETLHTSSRAVRHSKSTSAYIRNAQRELNGHSAPVVCARWLSADAAVSCSWDHTLIHWNVDSGTQIHQAHAQLRENEKLTSMCLDPTSLSTAVCSATDGVLRQWDMRTGSSSTAASVVHSFTAHEDVISSVSFVGPNQLVSGSDDRTVKVWDLRAYNTPLCTIRCPARVNRIGISPLSNMIAIPMDDKPIRVHDLKGNRLVRFHNKDKAVRSLSFSSWLFSRVSFAPWLFSRL